MSERDPELIQLETEVDRDPELVQLEIEVHEALTPWIREYGKRSGGKFYDVGYDGRKEQRLDEPYSPPVEYPGWVPDKVILHFLKKALVEHLGSRDKADEAIDTLRTAPASPDSDLSIPEALAASIDANEAVGVLVDHTQEDDLRDAGYALALLILSMNEVRYRRHAALLIGLNMSRQGIRKDKKWWQIHEPQATVASEATKAFGVVWAMQNSDNRRKLPIPDAGTWVVKKGVSRATKTLRKDGVMLGIVPSGSGNDSEIGENGEIIAVRKKIEPETFGFFGRMDKLLPFGMYKDRISPGSLYEVKSEADGHGSQRDEKIEIVDAALHELAEKNAELMNRPYKYTNSKGEEIIVRPETSS